MTLVAPTPQPPWYPPFSAAAPGGVFPALPAEAVAQPPSGTLVELWRAASPGCERIVASSTMVVASGSQGSCAWAHSGGPEMTLPLVGPHLAFNGEGTHVVGVGDDGMPRVVSLADASKSARVALHYSGARDVHAILSCGEVVVFGTTTRPGWHGERPFTLVEFVQLVDADDIDECGYVEGVEDLGAMMCDDVVAPSLAAGPGGVVAGTDAGVTRFALDGSVLSFDATPSRPLGIAVLDAGGWVAVVQGVGAVELWWSGVDGAEPCVTRLPLEVWPTGRPPLCAGYGSVFLTPPGEVLGCSRDGVVFRFRRVGESQGVSTGAGGLLVEHDAGLWTCDAAGTAEVVWSGGALVAAPVVVQGRVFVATAQGVVGLGAG